MKTKTTKSHAAVVTSAAAFAKKVNRQYGACDTVRAVTQRFPSLTRGEMLTIAKAVGINKHTASTQYQRVRSGAIAITLS